MKILGSARAWDGLMTWVTLSNGTCPLFFPLEVDIFDLARPLNSRGKKGVSLRQKCRGGHAPIVAVLRGKTVTHVMRSCHWRAGRGVSPRMCLAPRALLHASWPRRGKVCPKASAESLGSKADSVEPKAKKPGSLSDH